jgi:hypothetical protein
MQRITIVAVVGLLLLLSGLQAKAADFDTPFSQVISGSCVLEDVAVVGVIHTSAKQTQVGDFLRIDVKDWTKGEGTGLSSGVKYQVSGKTTQRIIISTETLVSFTYKNGFQLIGPGPDNNLRITYIFKQDATGVTVDDFKAECK